MSARLPAPALAVAAVVAAAAAIQLVPVRRDNPPVGFEVEAPPAVREVLERACYDCHSNRTRWPWYGRIAPVSWLVARDVHKGRRELNFTEWPAFDFEEQEHLLADIAKQVERRRMPLPIYLTLHPEARISAGERRALVAWARGQDAAASAAEPDGGR
uniref:Haem-binding domain-containing protein n=1 Tax=Eiseniibacteriota bacterium TaxID=2212470 RepID=A0A832MJN2_UNCEI